VQEAKVHIGLLRQTAAADNDDADNDNGDDDDDEVTTCLQLGHLRS
jgi:hypothetical protein